MPRSPIGGQAGEAARSRRRGPRRGLDDDVRAVAGELVGEPRGSVVRSSSRSSPSSAPPSGVAKPAQPDGRARAGRGRRRGAPLPRPDRRRRRRGRRRPAARTRPPGRSALGVPTTRESRKTRSAPRSRSWPTRYQRPRQETTPHGWTRRRAGTSSSGRGSRTRLRGGRGPRRSRARTRVRRRRAAAAAGWRGRVDVDAGGLELDQRAVRGAGQLGGLPQPRARPTAAASSPVEPDLGQLVVGARDPVAVLGVEDAGPAGLQRHAHLAQLGLVPLEHALERLVGAFRAVVGLVAGHGGADLGGREELSRAQQADDQVHQSFCPLGRHGVQASQPAATLLPPVRRRRRCWLACAHALLRLSPLPASRIRWRRGRVTATGRRGRDSLELTVEVPDEGAGAGAGLPGGGRAPRGRRRGAAQHDALAQGLGTGGVALVVALPDRLPPDPTGPGSPGEGAVHAAAGDGRWASTSRTPSTTR